MKLHPFIKIDKQNTKKIVVNKFENFNNWSTYKIFVLEIEKFSITENKLMTIIIKDNLCLGDCTILVSDSSPIKKIRIAYSV
jgi:hypothetical protein